MTPAARLIELAPFDREVGGSFIPLLAALALEAGARGWRPEIVLPEAARGRDWTGDLGAAGARIHYAPALSRRRRVGWLGALLEADRGPLVMHSHFTTWDVAAAALASRRNHRRAFWHVQTILGRGPLAVARNLAKFGALSRRVDGVLCPVVNIASDLRARGVPESRIHVVPSGIDGAHFPLLDDRARQGARERLGLPVDAEVLLHFGWDWEIKGGDLFLAAVARLIGDGRTGVLALAQRGGEPAQEAARRMGIEEHVRVTGTVPDVTDLFGAATVFLAVSEREGMPFSVLESVCCGTPVVASDLPGHAIVADCVPTCVVVPREPADIAEAVLGFLEMPADRRAADGAAGRAWVAENLSASRMAARMLDLFERGKGAGESG